MAGKNSNYNRGANIERKLVKEFRDQGYYAVRSAGSHSVFDVIAFLTDEVWAIQVKRTKSKRKHFIREANMLKNMKVPYNVHKFLYVWKDNTGWVEKTCIR